MATKKMKVYKGRAIRLTRLDQCGNVVFGPSSQVVTYGFITVTISEDMEDGETYRQKNAFGEYCLNEKDPAIMNFAAVSIELCEVDPDILDIVGGANPVIVGDDTIGWTRGTAPNYNAFALELWGKQAGAGACGAEGEPEWGYIPVPFLKNGKIDGDLAVGNAPLNITLTAEGYGAPATWGEGPYGDNPFLKAGGFPTGEVYGAIVTTVQPPDPTDGAQPIFALNAVVPGAFYTDPAITAESAPEAATLTALGYIVDPSEIANWTAGEFFTINTYRFNWTGAAWAAGPHA